MPEAHVMSRDLSTMELLEIRKEILRFTSANGSNLETVFRRHKQGYYSHAYFKNRIYNSIYAAIRVEYDKATKEESHAPIYPTVRVVLKDMYDYKQYKKRNENENKNEDFTTGI